MQPTPDWRAGAVFLKQAAPELAPYLKAYGACTLEPKPADTYFEILLTGVVAQQLPPQVSLALVQKLTAAAGGKLTPASILAVAPQTLQECGLAPQKVEYARNFAGMVTTGIIDPGKFTDQTDSQILKQLLAVRGLGRWTIEMFLLLSLCRADVLPGDDYLLKKEFQNLYNLETLPKRGQIIKLTQGWHPWRGLAAWYLWQHAGQV
jgi:DNA-3-methyladenine glycosylase II